MIASFGWGTLAASSLVIGSLVAIWLKISLRAIGLIMAFGSGVLISAVAFDLVEEAAGKASGGGAAACGLFVGCGVFFGGDWLVSRLGGGDRKDATGDQEDGSAMAIVLGSVLDGIPDDGDRFDDLRRGQGGRRISGSGLHLQSSRVDLVDDWDAQRRLEEVASPVDVGRDRRHIGTGLRGRLRPVPRRLTRHHRVRAVVCGGCDPHHAREHDDAGGVPARGQAGRGRHDDRIRGGLRDPPSTDASGRRGGLEMSNPRADRRGGLGRFSANVASLLTGLGALVILFGLARTRVNTVSALLALIIPTLVVILTDAR